MNKSHPYRCWICRNKYKIIKHMRDAIVVCNFVWPQLTLFSIWILYTPHTLTLYNHNDKVLFAYGFFSVFRWEKYGIQFFSMFASFGSFLNIEMNVIYNFINAFFCLFLFFWYVWGCCLLLFFQCGGYSMAVYDMDILLVLALRL